MSKIIHNSIGLLNPVFNMVYEKMQTKNIKTYAYENATKDMGKILKSMNLKKPLIVTDKMIIQIGLHKTMIKSLESESIEYIIYDSIEPNPTTKVVEEGANISISNDCDSIISFGGGSPIDASKVIAGLSKNPKLTNYSGLLHLSSFSKKNGVLPIISVPTTSGTGAEVTLGAVISNSVTHKKGIVIDKEFVSKNVFLDPNLTLGLPASVTAATTFDALTHAVESIISKFATEETSIRSIDAIKKIFKYLPRAYKNGQDIEARQNLLSAANDAGKSISRTHIGTAHSIGHNAGAVYNIPHGVIIGMLLPYVCELYRECCKSQFSRIADALEITLKNDTEEEKTEKFIKAIKKLSKIVNMPQTSEKIDEKKFEEIATRAIKEAYFYPIPKYASKEEIILILKKLKQCN